MTRRTLMIGAIILALIAIPVVVWLAAPLFVDNTIDEAFPFELPPANEIAAMSPAEAERAVEGAMAAVDEAFVAGLSDEAAADLEARMMDLAAVMPDHEMDETMPAATAEWTSLTVGQFRGADSFHQGSGTAAIFQQGEQRVLRLEAFAVTNGPDLHILLVENPNATGHDELGEYVDLGSLKGNRGSQNYEIPASANLDDFGGVMIYCMPFHVVFATAPFGQN